MEAHVNKFDRNRMECLSSCFVNVELYGCTYPTGVMRELEELSREVEEEVEGHRLRMKERMEVRFTFSL